MEIYGLLEASGICGVQMHDHTIRCTLAYNPSDQMETPLSIPGPATDRSLELADHQCNILSGSIRRHAQELF